jgi:hypothetical protein
MTFNVPPFPGVPPLSGVQAALPIITALIADASNVQAASSAAPQWGVFMDADAVIVPDSIIGVEKTKECRISDYPVEDGSFQSYNKVETPFDAHVTMTKGGSDADRADFLDTLEDIVGSLDLYDVVTPERTYESANLERYSYERTSRAGATMITATLWLREVRVTATSAFSNVAQPASATAKDGGSVQAAAPTPDQTAAASDGAS